MRRTKAPDIGELLDSIASLGGIDIHPAGCRSMARALNRPCLCLSGREALAFPHQFYFKEPDGSHWWIRMELLPEDLHLAQPGSHVLPICDRPRENRQNFECDSIWAKLKYKHLHQTMLLAA